jgi:S1-C subfamily serine protease
MKLMILLALVPAVVLASVESVVKNTESKVVKIGMVTDTGAGVCSGAIISEGGIVLTCAHCFALKGLNKVYIKLSDGKYFPAQPLLIDVDADLALIAPVTFQGKMAYFKMGKEPQVGQEVVSFGSPLGIQHTVTVGTVINKNGKHLLHSAFVNPGNSGGPLVDLSGRLVGLNEATIRTMDDRDAQGLFVAIGLSQIRAFLERK